MGTQSRRSFIEAAGTTLLIAGLTGMGLTGCGLLQEGMGMDASSAADCAWDEETDVLVVGAGLAGTSAAITIAKSDPEARCLLLKKGQTALGNGNSASMSSWSSSSSEQEQDALELYRAAPAVSDTGTPDDVLEAYAAELTRNLDWVLELGATEDDLTIVPGTTDYACFPNIQSSSTERPVTMPLSARRAAGTM